MQYLYRLSHAYIIGRNQLFLESLQAVSTISGWKVRLSNAEWALVEDLFDNAGGRGKPPRYARRLLVDACCYVVRTGSAWRMLPKGFVPWQNVYRTFRRWSEQGRFERMHDRLRAQWRARRA